jgi:hypothetical protein
MNKLYYGDCLDILKKLNRKKIKRRLLIKKVDLFLTLNKNSKFQKACTFISLNRGGKCREAG